MSRVVSNQGAQGGWAREQRGGEATGTYGRQHTVGELSGPEVGHGGAGSAEGPLLGTETESDAKKGRGWRRSEAGFNGGRAGTEHT